MSSYRTATSLPNGGGLPNGGEADIVAEFRARHLELVKLAALLLGDYVAAEDVVQDVFTRVWEGRQRLAASGFSAPYFYRAVVNSCRTVHRRRQVTLRFGGRAEVALRSEPGTSAEEVVLRADEDQRLLRALATLPQRQREAIILRYYQRMPEAEIAEVMRISRGTVKSTTSRGLAALGKRLQQEGI
jgi:RNA polymerase sigma-70 factor (sigma-E family)